MPGSVVGLSNRHSLSLTPQFFSRVPSLHGHYPLRRYYGPLRLPVQPESGYGFPVPVGGARPRHRTGSPRFLGGPVRMRRPLPPREASKVLVLVTTLAVAGFTTLWRVGHLHKRNEAEPGSLALRLTRSLAGASTPGLLPSPPGPLPAERAIRKATSFQVTRSARLILALQRRGGAERSGITAHSKLGIPASLREISCFPFHTPLLSRIQYLRKRPRFEQVVLRRQAMTACFLRSAALQL